MMEQDFFRNRSRPLSAVNFLFLLFVFCLPCSSPANAQQTNVFFEHYTDLSAYVVPCILQDKTGYLWFGTYGGIDRYDGNKFISYKHEPGNPHSINNGSVQALHEDRDGSLWIGTSRGLDKMDRTRNTFTHLFSLSAGFRN